MKRLSILLLISLIVPIGSFSRTIYPDTTLTAQDLKKLDLILVQHSKWESEVPLLYKQINTYKDLCKFYEVSDSLNNESKKLYKEEINTQNETIKKLHKTNKVYKGVSIGTSILAIICLILL